MTDARECLFPRNPTLTSTSTLSIAVHYPHASLCAAAMSDTLEPTSSASSLFDHDESCELHVDTRNGLCHALTNTGKPWYVADFVFVMPAM
jgi:hypothetical protein